MIYLDNAATGGFKPLSVQTAVAASLQSCANPGRSGHALSLALSERVLACRRALCSFFNAPSYERVIFTKNCTEALNLALLGTLCAGDHVVTTALEHNSVLRPLEHLKTHGKVRCSVAPLEDGVLKEDTVLSLVEPNTRMVCVTSASNVTGQCPDLSYIKKNLREDVLFLVDGAQGAGHIPLDMQNSGIDFLAVAGHKGLHAIQGAGALLFSERVNPKPVLFGGTGSESYSLSMPAFYPDALESGTLSYPAIASLFEGLIVAQATQKEGSANLLNLTTALYTALQGLEDYTPYFKPNPCGIASFAHAKLPSQTVAQILSDEYGICVRAGWHCAPLVHRSLSTEDGLVRASLSPFQSMREVEALVRALRKIG